MAYLTTTKSDNVFCYVALMDKGTEMLYTDTTGALPVCSINGNQCYYVAYDYNTHYINAWSVDDLMDETIIKTFGEIFKYME